MPYQVVKTLCSAVTDTGAKDTVNFQRRIDQAGTLFVEESGSGTFSLTIEGRMDSGDTFTAIPVDGSASTSTSGAVTAVTEADADNSAFVAFAFPILPQMRVNISANSGSTLTVKIDE